MVDAPSAPWWPMDEVALEAILSLVTCPVVHMRMGWVSTLETFILMNSDEEIGSNSILRSHLQPKNRMNNIFSHMFPVTLGLFQISSIRVRQVFSSALLCCLARLRS